MLIKYEILLQNQSLFFSLGSIASGDVASFAMAIPRPDRKRLWCCLGVTGLLLARLSFDPFRSLGPSRPPILPRLHPVDSPVSGLKSPFGWVPCTADVSLIGRLDLRRAKILCPSFVSFSCKLYEGKRMARSSSYGKPRCRPRICIAMMTSFERTWNSAEKDALMVGYPNERPTVP